MMILDCGLLFGPPCTIVQTIDNVFAYSWLPLLLPQ